MTAHRTNVTRETAITAGTNTAATASARRCTGAFDPCASSTRRMIWAKVVWRPTRVVSILKVPILLMVAPKTFEPACFSTGMLSPVSIDSSTEDRPSVTTPSTGTFSPGRTMTMSPTATSSTGTSTSRPSRTMRAVFALRPMRRLIAEALVLLAFASSQRPKRMSAMMITDASK
jgi:hypothetical protein